MQFPSSYFILLGRRELWLLLLQSPKAQTCHSKRGALRQWQLQFRRLSSSSSSPILSINNGNDLLIIISPFSSLLHFSLRFKHVLICLLGFHLVHHTVASTPVSLQLDSASNSIFCGVYLIVISGWPRIRLIILLGPSVNLIC